jgi:hypothetical protein
MILTLMWNGNIRVTGVDCGEIEEMELDLQMDSVTHTELQTRPHETYHKGGMLRLWHPR